MSEDVNSNLNSFSMSLKIEALSAPRLVLTLPRTQTNRQRHTGKFAVDLLARAHPTGRPTSQGVEHGVHEANRASVKH